MESPTSLPISARDRRGDGDAARLHVGFLVADDLVGLFFFGVLVDELHLGAELDLVAGHLGEVDDFGARRQVLELADAAFVVALGFLGGMVLGIFREVAMGARFRNRLDDPRDALPAGASAVLPAA